MTAVSGTMTTVVPNESERPLISIEEGRSRIEAALAPLIGKLVWNRELVIGMLRLGFGAPSSVPVEVGPKKGEMEEMYDYQLHVQAPWHLTADGAVVLKSGSEVEADDTGRSNDRALAVLREVVGSGVHEVRSVGAEGEGGAVIGIGDSIKLRIYTPISAEWRLFTPEKSQPHFVVRRSVDDDTLGALLIAGCRVSNA